MTRRDARQRQSPSTICVYRVGRERSVSCSISVSVQCCAEAVLRAECCVAHHRFMQTSSHIIVHFQCACLRHILRHLSCLCAARCRGISRALVEHQGKHRPQEVDVVDLLRSALRSAASRGRRDADNRVGRLPLPIASRPIVSYRDSPGVPRRLPLPRSSPHRPLQLESHQWRARAGERRPEEDT